MSALLCLSPVWVTRAIGDCKDCKAIPVSRENWELPERPALPGHQGQPEGSANKALQDAPAHSARQDGQAIPARPATRARQVHQGLKLHKGRAARRVLQDRRAQPAYRVQRGLLE